jgi:hypothetical protein
MLAILLFLFTMISGVQDAAPIVVQVQQFLNTREQSAVYDHSLQGYYAIGTPVTFTATQLQLFGDPAGTYTGTVTGYMLTSYPNQPLSAGVATVDYVVSYSANGLQRVAGIPSGQVSG